MATEMKNMVPTTLVDGSENTGDYIRLLQVEKIMKICEHISKDFRKRFPGATRA
jgi:hypothetical protein